MVFIMLATTALKRLLITAMRTPSTVSPRSPGSRW
jgi:hypothetical protein